MEGPKKETLDPETQRQVDDIMKYISNLKYSSDLNKRVESLIALNEIIQAIQKHEKGIQHTANDLISAFTHVLIDIFERPRQDTPLRFAKYFVTIVNKTCQCSTIMSVVREQELYELGE
jgi:tRNA uridine 5-carbamoylmethylation protein Kti12